jgi:hypothetical protein
MDDRRIPTTGFVPYSRFMNTYAGKRKKRKKKTTHHPPPGRQLWDASVL